MSSSHAENELTIMLVFPKAFERDLFLSDIYHLGHPISVDYIDKFMIHDIYWIIGDTYQLVRCLCIGKSDIEFAIELMHFIDVFRDWEKDVGLAMVLCGTAGGDSTKHKIGQAFRINKAYKVDRGELFMEENAVIGLMDADEAADVLPDIHLLPRVDKLSTAFAIPDEIREVAISICSNHIMNVELQGFAELCKINLSEESNAVLDMETYDFFKVCETKGLKYVKTIRVVSDMFSMKSKKYVKAIRKAVPMINMVSQVHRMIYELTLSLERPKLPSKMDVSLMNEAMRINMDEKSMNEDYIQNVYGWDKIASLDPLIIDIMKERGIECKRGSSVASSSSAASSKILVTHWYRERAGFRKTFEVKNEAEKKKKRTRKSFKNNEEDGAEDEENEIEEDDGEDHDEDEEDDEEEEEEEEVNDKKRKPEKKEENGVKKQKGQDGAAKPKQQDSSKDKPKESGKVTEDAVTKAIAEIISSAPEKKADMNHIGEALVKKFNGGFKSFGLPQKSCKQFIEANKKFQIVGNDVKLA